MNAFNIASWPALKDGMVTWETVASEIVESIDSVNPGNGFLPFVIAKHKLLSSITVIR